ncbi:MAG: arginine--tRNA ligase [Actinomycetota bacterium]|nr:arginine--tRNA ligase [Actinomycetota bacterium]
MTPLGDLRAAVRAAAVDLRGGNGASASPPPNLERARKPEFGDYSTNAAMLLAPVLGEPPRVIAGRLGGVLAERLGDRLDHVEVAGPGFLNLFLSDAWYGDALGDALRAGEDFGGGGALVPERVLIEFVSANPTGPLTAAGGRHAAYGDALARTLEFVGHGVEREYYVNDHGSQVDRLGESIRARARGQEPPEGGYEGDYVRALAAELPHAADAGLDALALAAVGRLVEQIRATLTRFGVEFDAWFSERSLHESEPSAVEAHYGVLEREGHIYRQDGAVWLRTSAFGDDKDRVLQRSSGEHTYFAADVAYHEDKRERGFDRLIDVWGADHHGYVARIRAAFAALGGDPAQLELIIMQFVNVIERGERAAMSKRRGDFVTLDEVIDQIGVDAARFFLLQRSHDTTVDLDLDLAREQSNENPVYYVQYAHARIASIRTKAGEARVVAALEAVATDGGGPAPLDPAERTLINKLLAFPGVVDEAADQRAPHKLAVYALALAQEFTAFYRDCRVIGAEPEAVESFRLALSVLAQRTLARTLDLLGVQAPSKM